MKKVFLTLTMLLFAFMGTMKAGIVEIGDGGTTTNSYLPTYTYYKYSLTQQIFTADEIGVVGDIASIAFYNKTNERTRNINMYFVLTDKETFESNTDWITATEDDLVFSGEMTFTPGEWNTITLNELFQFDGTSNLAVIVDDNTGSYQSAMACYVFNATSQAIRVYSDNTDYDPFDPSSYTGSVLTVKNQIQLMFIGEPEIVANPSSLDMGYRPNGAWMAPVSVELTNVGRTATVSSVTTSNDFFIANANVPFTLGFGDDPEEIEISTGTGTAGTQEGSIVVTYTDRSTTVIPVVATAYAPAAGDVWENAVEVNTFPYNETAPAGIYHNYELPDGDPDAADAMYKVTFDQDVLLTANAAGTNGVAAIYAEDFNGEPGPGVNNVFSAGASITPVDYWFPGYEYTDGNTFFGTSSGGGFIWGYKVAPEYLAGYGQCYLTQVEAAAYEAYPYNLYVLRGGDSPEEAEMIYYQEMEGDAEPSSFFTMDLTAPFVVGEDENLWVLFYSASPYAAYCGKVPTDAENGKIWYTLDGSTWYSNDAYTPVIGLHLQFPNPGGRSVVLNLADMSANEFKNNGTVSEATGTVMAPRRNRDNVITDMFVPAGTYYLAMASTTPSFGVNIATAEVPAPEQAVLIAPEDGALGVDNGDLLQWTLGDYTSEFQIILGTQFPPTDVYVDWTNYLYESMELENLLHNKTYFVQINARNSTGTTMGEITGFTTVIDGVEGFTVESDKLYPGDAAVFSWEAPARSFKGYNLYKDGVKVNETPISGTTYSVEGLEYNMDGYAFQLAVLYDEGESALTDPITVYMTGMGSINGHVWEMDSITPVYNVAIQLIGLDEYGIEQTLSIPGTTNPSGYFEGEALTGTYQAIGVKEGYQANPSVEFVIENTLLTPDINVYALEDWAPLGTIRATEEEDDVLVEWSWDPASMIVDFETGDFSQAEFDNTISSYPWAVTTSNPYEGTYSMKSTCEGVNSATSAIQVTVDVPYDGKMGFYLRVSSESNYDKFHFYIDGTEQGQAISGTLNYTYKEYAVTEGTHTYKWEYTKDSSVNSGDDCVNVDNITMYRQDIPVPPTPGATVYDFENGIQGWTSLDANNDGYGWVLGSEIGGVYLAAGASLAGSGHDMSNDLVCSGSFSNATGAAITPDNYLVSPAKISAHSGASINFWACAQDASYAAEHFGVAVSTGSNSNASDFTTIQEWTMTAKGPQGRTAETEFDIRGTRDQGTWYQYNVDLSSYAGQEIWVAIRHFNCNDQFILNVDDITLADGSAKVVAKGPKQDRTLQKFYLYRRNTYTGEGDTIVETLGSFGLNTFDYIDNQWNNLPFGEYQWGIQAYYEGNHHYPEKGRDAVSYDFEDNTMMGWTTIDADGDGFNWGLGSDLMSGFTGHDDSYEIVTSQSYDFDAGALTPDNYLVSPAKAAYSQISFWACAQDAAYPSETFGVAVSTGSNTNPSDFTTVQQWTMTAKKSGTAGLSRNGDIRTMGNWYQFTVDLSSYAGQEIWVALRHFNCTDMFYLDVDDITLTSDGGVTPPDPPTPPTPGTGGSLTIDFETGDFSQYEFDNNSSYPWQVVAGGADGSAYCMKSTNAGVASSESAISATVEYVQDGTVTFDANCQGEGTSTIWDKCRFFIDGAEQFSYGANVSGWHNYSFNVTAGSHLFTWSYSKDGSVNPTGDCFQVDNIVFDGVAGGPGPNGGANGYSEILWSNVIDKDMEQEVTFNIALNNNQSPAGATLSMVGPTTYEITFDETATYVFDALRRGVYDITVELPGYATIETTMPLGEYDTYNILMEEVLATVDNLYVSATGWAMWDNSLVTSGPTIGDGGSITGGGGSTPTPPGPPTPPGSGDSFTEGFESGMPSGWTVIDANNDSWTWCLTSAIPSTWTYYASVSLDWYRTGSNAICSGSFINGVGALTPDEYLVTSQVTLTSGSTFSFWAAACDASYPADHFGVFVSDNGTSGWTMVNEWTLTGKSNGEGGRASRDGNGAKLGTWHQFSVDLSAFAGQKYIAIRHFNCNDQYIMCVDDIELTAGSKNTRTALKYKVEFEGVYEGETDYRFWQNNVDNLNEGDVVLTRVAAVYATGMSDWAEYEWVYTPCDNFEGATNVTATENEPGTAVELSWTMPDGGVTPPTPPTPGTGEWYYYDNGVNDDAIGTGGGNFWWGVMFPAGSYDGNMVTKTAAFDYMAMTGTVTIYNDGATVPASPVGTANVTFTGSTDFVEVEFATPVTIDPTKNLWIVYYNGNGASYPAAVCPNTGDPNGRWVSLDGASWDDLASYGLDYTFMVRAYVANGAKGEVHEITVPQQKGGTGTFANAGVAKPHRAAWDLVASFTGTSAGQQAVATDGNYIYTASWQTTPTGGNTFYQYNLDGTFVEGFDIAGATGIRDMTTDGEYFYATSGGAQIFILDLANRTLVGTITCSGLTSRHISYDPERDGFWSGNWSTLALYSRTGALIQSATAPESAYGSAYYKDADNVEHLYMFCQPNSDAKVYDYNIATNTISGPIFDFAATPGFDGIAGGCFIGTYDGKTCWFGNSQQDPNLVGIYELDSNGVTPPTPPTGNILGALVYRDGELLTPSPITETTFVDEDMAIGEHDYCIRVVYSDWTMSCMECATIDYTDVEENDVVDNIYPNPTRDIVTIEAQGMNHISVFNTLGQVVYDADVDADMLQLNLGQYNAGLYLVRVSTQNGISVKRVTVVK